MEIAALHHQLLVYQRKDKRPKIKPTDRILWPLISKLWPGWKDALYFVKPATITEHPTAKWTTQQIVEAFPWEIAPRYLLRDRDKIYGSFFQDRVKNMDIKEVKISPRSPWQSPYVERIIGSIRRECLDHMIVFNESHLKKILTSYLSYYHRYRTHLTLDGDCPESRTVQTKEMGKVIAFPEVGGLHHHYERRKTA